MHLATPVRDAGHADAAALAGARRAAFAVIFDALDCIAVPAPLALRR
ncbi:MULTISPECIES: hypothetical protein [Methylobacterium]|nr:hypothetical protein [Methylobacterium sp. DB0501]NGM33164.1 hypothetical protein [Methylobacterium sp. DB0501]